MKFVITGLPRSRTAWFAAYFMGVEDTVCYHEGYYHDNDMGADYKNVGNSEAGIREDWMAEHKPDKVVIVHREVPEVYRSLEIIGMPCKPGFLEELDERMSKLEGLHVDFYDIDLEAIHDYLGLPFDPYRAALFEDMNVQSKHWRL